MKFRLASFVIALVSPSITAQDLRFDALHNPLPVSSGYGAVVGDVDNDGDPDVLYNTLVSSVLLRNDGSGLLVEDGVVAPWVQATALGDFDGDSDLDVLVGVSQLSGYSVYINDGSGGFSEAQQPPLAYGQALVGDLNMDGLDDVLVGRGLTFSILGGPDLVFLGAGGGAFQLPLDLGRESLSSALADFDGDSDLDLVRVDRATGATVWAANDGSGSFGPDRVIAPSGIQSARPIDLDSDGAPDLILTPVSSTSPLLAYRNDGTGSFSSVGSLPPGVTAVSFLASADLDGDGDTDIATSEAIFLNDGKRGFVRLPGNRVPPVGPFTSVGGVSDFDGDGRLDFLVDYGQRAALWWNEATRFRRAGPEDVPFVGTSASAEDALFGDVNQDGWVDLLSAPNEFDPFVFLGDGTGVFGELQNAFPRSSGVPKLLQDADGDGDLDVWTAAYTGFGRSMDLYVNDGVGEFTPHPTTQQVGSLPPLFEVGDIDGDGDGDVVTVGIESVALNDGVGGFQFAPNRFQPPLSTGSASLSLGDVDRDGDLDVLVATGQDLAIRLNRGDGFFTAVPVPVPTSTSPVFLAPATASFEDLNGDTSLDILRFDGPRNEVWSYLGDGLGGFVELGPFALASGKAGFYERADFTGDGLLDLFLFGEESELLVNDGSGRFVLGSITGWIEEWTLAKPNAESVQPTDWDGDGDLDYFYLPNSAAFANLERQLRWTTPPRIGQALEMELWGPADAEWALFAATRRATIATPLGTLQLAAGRAFVGRGRLDGSGRDTLALAVPNDPGLLGLDFFWQALIGGPQRWSNLERTTLRAR